MRKQRVIARWRSKRKNRNGNSLRAVWIALCDLHGRRGRAAAGANVFRMRLLGAEVITERGHAHEGRPPRALRDWVTNVHDTHLPGARLVPTYPLMVRISDCDRREAPTNLFAAGKLPRADGVGGG
jgi:tryptophan synthase beta subunit